MSFDFKEMFLSHFCGQVNYPVLCCSTGILIFWKVLKNVCVCVGSGWDWALRSGGKEEGGVDRGVDQQPFRADISPEWKHDRDKDKPRKWRLTTVKADGAGAGDRGPSQREAVTLLLQWPVRPAAPPCWSLSPLDLVTAALLCCLGSREW